MKIKKMVQYQPSKQYRWNARVCVNNDHSRHSFTQPSIAGEKDWDISYGRERASLAREERTIYTVYVQRY